MKDRTPFRRILAFMVLAAKVGTAGAIAELGHYQSRGHGRGTYGGKKPMRCSRSKYMPHQGMQEKARRLRRMQACIA